MISPQDSLHAIGFVVLLVLAMVGLSWAVWATIWPVERRARAQRGPFRFRLIDLCCLLVYWQVILAAGVALGRGNAREMMGLLTCFGITAVSISALTWGVCVGVLARAGIDSSSRRAAFMLVSVPGAVAGAAAFVASGLGTVVIFVNLITSQSTDQSSMMPVAAFAVSILAIYLLRRLSVWIAAESQTT